MQNGGSYRAARLLGRGNIDVVSIPTPTPQRGEVGVRILQCGVCTSNVPPWEGRSWFNYPSPPGAPGHEATGRVETVGEGVMDFQIGDRVAYIGERGFAEQEFVAASSLLKLPQEVGRDFLAEPMACTMNIFRRSGIQAGDVVAIIGLGFLGRLLVPLVLHAGARVLAVSRRPILDLHRATAISGKDNADLLWQVKKVTGDRLCDVVIEATGKQQPLELAGELTRVRGRLVIAGYHQEPRQINMQQWNWRGLDVTNAHERDPAIYLQGMREALDAVRSGVWSLEGLISHRYSLEQLGEALRITAERPTGFIKAVIEP